MQLKLLFFGVLTDIVGNSTIKYKTDLKDIDELKKALQNQYPNLAKQTYKIAINQEIITENSTINDNDEIAFLPPFAGG